EMSPLRVNPDLKVAVVFGIDASGSMEREFESATQVLLEAKEEFDKDDDLIAMTFAEDAKIMEFSLLRKQRPTGGTSLIKGIETARLHLEARKAGRKVIVLMTDGETKETPEEIKSAIGRLGEIGLVVITLVKDVPGAKNVHIRDWNQLQQSLRDVTVGIKDFFKAAPGELVLRKHPVTEGVSSIPLPWINRTTAKPEAQVIATVGQPPAQDPAIALGQAGEGRVAAFAFSYEPRLELLFRKAIEQVAGESDNGLTLSID